MSAPGTTYVVTGFPSWIARAAVREIAQGDEGARVHLLVPSDRQREAEEFCRELRALASTVGILRGDAVRMDLGLPGRDYVALAKDVDVFVDLYDVSPLPEDGAGAGYGGLCGKLGDPAELTLRAAGEALEFASAAGRLRHLVHLGSLSIAGGRREVWTEEDLSAGQRHRTAAERARHAAERLLWRARDRVPFTSVRVGPVVGDSRTGEIGWYHGPHDLLEALLVAPAVPSWPRGTPAAAGVHAVPSDHLARVIRALAAAPPVRSGAIHVAPPAPVPLAHLQEAVVSPAPAVRIPGSLRSRLRRRYGAGVAALLRTVAHLDTPAPCSARRALDVERAAGIVPPRLAECLPHLVAHARARVAAEAQRLADAGVEDALDG